MRHDFPLWSVILFGLVLLVGLSVIYNQTQILKTYQETVDTNSKDQVTIDLAHKSRPHGPRDNTKPSVNITNPKDGEVVSGTVTITAEAYDKVGVTSVQFFVGGTLIGDDISEPYSTSWDTNAYVDGQHTLTAVARDAAGNSQTSLPVVVTVSNGGPPVPFDFTISVNPNYGTVVKGSSISTTITVTLTSGTSKQINLSSSCPPASTCTRSPQTGFPTYTSTFTVATTTATTPNLYSITIRGLAPDGTSKTTIYTLNVTDGSTPPAQCSDGIDNDGDGKIDYGTASTNDPGCSSATDNDEYNAPPSGGSSWMEGVNLAGAEFGETHLPGIYGTDYTYPENYEVDYYLYKGMKVMRLPFRWERLQHSANAALDSTELSRMNSIVNYATSKNMYVVLDPHNYARYYGNVIGSTAVPNSAFADFWSKVANVYKNNPKVIFGLMNEPHDMSTEQWVSGANAAISAIRSTGATNRIFVPGNGWTGCHSWSQTWYGTANSVAMRNIVDSGNNFAIECHQYLDSDSSGTSATCVSSTIGSERLQGFTAWARTNNYKAFLGEFAGADNSVCNAAGNDMLNYAEANKDVWEGWSWWAGGPWWGGYMFSSEPTGCNKIDPATCVDKPQMNTVMEFHINNGGSGSPQCSDSLDNDNDGLTDFGTASTNDPGCSSATDSTETGTAICDNGVDETNDADSLADYRLSSGDPGCTSVTDTNEIDALCDDKLDNDADGLTDFGTASTNDPGCTSYSDNDETNAPSSGSGTLDLRIPTAADDIEEQQAGNIYQGSSDLEMMNDGSNIQRAVGLRYQLNIPRASNIITAYIQFTVDETSSDATSLTIQAEDVGNSPVFGSSTNDVTNRVKTTASALWVPFVWSTVDESNTNERTSDIKSVVQEVVDRSDWSANNYISFIITGSGKRVARSYESSSTQAALLHVEYGPACTPACTGGQYCDAGICKSVCSDSVDNDNDGRTDFGTASTNDPGCSSATDSTETGTAICDNGVDETNDADTLADYRLNGAGDPGCSSVTDTSEVSGQCDDTLDNDADTFTDYPSDIGCTAYTDNDETNPPLCGDGIDNDNDGLIDYGTASTNDPGCSSATDITETSTAVCDNGADATNDRDTLADYRLNGAGDPGCTSVTDTSEIDGMCDDNVDDVSDADTLTDASDLGCSSTADTSEIDGQCDDKIDNDGDGKIDYGTATTNDPECLSFSDSNEAAGPNLLATPPNFKVAFTADTSGGTNFRNVLTLIKNEGAKMVVTPGDLGYGDSPQTWNQAIIDILDSSTSAVTCVNNASKKMFPFFLSMGNHEPGTSTLWTGTGNYRDILKSRLDCLGIDYDTDGSGAYIPGNLGTRSSFAYQNLFVTLTAPGECDGTADCGGTKADKESYITRKMKDNQYLWDIGAWHRVYTNMQIGTYDDAVTASYENTRKAGGIVITGHWHTYERTFVLNNMVTPTLASGGDSCKGPILGSTACPTPLTIRNDQSSTTTTDEGQTFAVVAALGGNSNRDQTRCLGTTANPYAYPYGCVGEWASVNSKNDYGGDANRGFGAFFIEFNIDPNVQGGPNTDPKYARAYYKTVDGAIWENEPFLIYNDAS